MTKLSQKEINTRIDWENGKNIDPSVQEITIPEDAHSQFRFQIKENIHKLLKEMKHGGQKGYWYFNKRDGNVELWTKRLHTMVTVKKLDSDTLQIEGSRSRDGAWNSFVYAIQNNKNGGADVVYDGLLTEMGQQYLLPKMSYVPHTLDGKIQGMTDWMPMGYFFMYCEQNNPGWLDYDCFPDVNKMFNNEVPSIKMAKSEQEYKNRKAQRQFGRKYDFYEMYEAQRQSNYHKNKIIERLQAKRDAFKSQRAAQMYAAYCQRQTSSQR